MTLPAGPPPPEVPVDGYGLPPEVAAPAGPRPSGFNGFAIAALVLGICSGSVLSLIFGIVALVQIRKSGQRGRGMAIAGISLSVLWMVVAGATVVVALNSLTVDRDAAGRITDGGRASLADLKEGDCIASMASLSTRVEAVPCTEPHHAQVYFVGPIASGPFGGDAWAGNQANDLCGRMYAVRVAARYDADDLHIIYRQPTEDSWRHNDRNAVCVISDDARLHTNSFLA